MASPSSSRNAQPVIIAGGGIGGLAAALALARKGFKSVVLEQAPQFGEIGAGIQIAPNAWHALDALGVGQLVKKEAVFIESLLMMDGVTGEKVIDIPLDARFAKRFGNPYAVCHRAVLDPADVPKDLRWAAATLWAADNTHIVHYPLRGWKLFNLVATVIGKHTSGGHNEAATREEAVGFFSHYCEKVLKLMRTP